MKIIIKESAYKDLKQIDKQTAVKILKDIQKLENYPDISNTKKLKNYTPTYRLRIGNYRVLFDIEDDNIVIGRILHRKDAYS